MRNTIRSMVLAGSVLAATAAIAHAQVTLLDTIGSSTTGGGATGLGITGNNTSNSPTVGYDPNSTTSSVPNTVSTAGYVVLPFTMTTATNYNLSSVTVVANIQTPFGQLPPNYSGQLWGEVIQAPTGSSPANSGGAVVGGFFSFAGTGTGASSNGLNEKYTATPTGVTLTGGGANYWLVLSPDQTLTPTAASSILDFGYIKTATGTKLASLAGTDVTYSSANQTLSSSYASAGQLLAGDSSSVSTFAAGRFGGVTLVGIAGVPETSTVITALIGLAPMGGLLLRRHRANA